MPNSIVVPVNPTEADTDPGLRPAIGRMPGLDLHHADARALGGRHSAQPSPSGDAAGETETAAGGLSLAQGSADADPPFAGTGPGTAGSGLGTTGSGLGSTGAGLGSSGTGFGSAGAGLGSAGTGFRPAGAGPGSPGTAPFQRGIGQPPTLPRRDAPGPATGEGDDSELAPGPRTAGTYRGLPRRVRQASLNPHLKDTPAAARGRDADGAPPSASRSPEDARSLVASMQSGWQRGREDDSDGESAAAQTASRQDSEAPQGEEA
jgi:hypothetical protein